MNELDRRIVQRRYIIQDASLPKAVRWAAHRRLVELCEEVS